MNLDIYDSLLEEAYHVGYTNHKDALVYIDKESTFKINLFNKKEILLNSHYLNEDNNYIYRKYFHLMIVIQFQYDLLFNIEDKELSKDSYYFSLKCGVLGFNNKELYLDINKYCNKLKPKVWKAIGYE